MFKIERDIVVSHSVTSPEPLPLNLIYSIICSINEGSHPRNEWVSVMSVERRVEGLSVRKHERVWEMERLIDR